MFTSIIVKNIIKNKKRAISIFICLLLSNIFFITSVIVYNGVKESEINNIKYEIAADNFSVNLKNKDQVEKLKKLDGVEMVGVENYIDSASENSKISYNIIQGNKDYFKQNNLELESGNLPTKPNEIALEKWVLKNLDFSMKLKVGDTLKLNQYNNGKEIVKTYKLVGIFTDSPSFKLNGYQQIYGVNSNYKTDFGNNKYHISVNKKYLKNFENNLLGIGIKSKDISINIMLNSAILSNNYKKILVVLVVISLINIYILYAIYNIYLIERSKEYGTYIALGIKKKTLMFMNFLELLIIQIVAFIASGVVVVGMVKSIIPKLIKIFSDNLTLNLIDIGINLYSVLFIMLVGLINIFIISQLYTKKIFKYGNIELLTGNIENYSKSKEIKVFTKKISSKIALAYVNRYKKKIISIILSLSVSTALILFASYYVRVENQQNEYMAELNKNNLDYSINMQPSDNLLNGFNEKDVTILENLKNEDNKPLIKKIEKVNVLYSRMEIDKSKINDKQYFKRLANMGYYKSVLNGVLIKQNDKDMLKLSAFGYNQKMLDELKKYTISGNFNNIKNDEVILFNPAVNKKPILNYKVGDSISISYPKKHNIDTEKYFKGADIQLNIVKLKIGAIVSNNNYTDNYYVGNDSPHVIMSNEQFSNIFGIDKYRTINIYKQNKGNSKANTYLDNKIYKTMEAYNGIYIQNIEKENNEINAQIYNKMTLIKVVAVVIFILGVVNLINVIVNEFLNRLYDYSLLNKLGGNLSIIRKISITEGIYIGGLSGIFGIVLALILQGVYAFKVGFYLINFNFHIYILDYVFMFLLNVLIGIVVSYLVYKKCSKDIKSLM